MWDLTQHRGPRRLREQADQEDNVSAVCWAPDGLLATAAHHGGVQLWDVATERNVLRLPGGAHCLAFSPDRRTPAGVWDESVVLLWEAASLLPAGAASGPGGAAEFPK